MNARLFDGNVLRSPSWWHWLATVPLLAATLAGQLAAAYAAIVLCCVMAGYYLVRVQAVKPFPVQVRLAYLLLLLAGLLPGQQWIHWVQLVGTSAMVLAGYCPLARMLQLAPWNRAERFTLSLVADAVFAPRAGGIIAGGSRGPQAATMATNACHEPSPRPCGVCELPSR